CPPDDRQISLVVELGEVAGAVPAVDECVGCGRRVVEVAAEHARPAHPQLARTVDAHLDERRLQTAPPRLAVDVFVLEGGDLGRPVLPLVKKMTWASSSESVCTMSSSLSPAAAASRRVKFISGAPTLAATDPASARSSSTTSSVGRAAYAVSTASAAERDGFI